MARADSIAATCAGWRRWAAQATWLPGSQRTEVAVRAAAAAGVEEDAAGGPEREEVEVSLGGLGRVSKSVWGVWSLMDCMRGVYSEISRVGVNWSSDCDTKV